eukprot:4243678-Pyramimonas_sp.AAC.1
MYKTNLTAWANRTAYKPQQRANRVLETFPIELQARFKPVLADLDKDEGLNSLLEHLGVLNGERPGDVQRDATNKALFDYFIHRNESITDF